MVNMVKKSKKPKYCENSNMFSGNFYEFMSKIIHSKVLSNKTIKIFSEAPKNK